MPWRDELLHPGAQSRRTWPLDGTAGSANASRLTPMALAALLVHFHYPATRDNYSRQGGCFFAASAVTDPTPRIEANSPREPLSTSGFRNENAAHPVSHPRLDCLACIRGSS